MFRVIDETTSDLQALIDTDFPASRNPELEEKRVLAWLHYKARSVPPRPRRVVISEEVQAAREAHPAIGDLHREFVAGGDISPWLSDRVRRRKEDPRADMMFNDWQINHFHLGRIFLNSNKIKRSENLLFAYIGSNDAVFLDVLPHNSWTNTGLLRILLRTQPNLMEAVEMHGILSTPTTWTDEERAGFRKKRMNSMIAIDGRLFAPLGLGLVGSGSALRLSRYSDGIKSMIKSIHDAISNNSVQPEVRYLLASKIGVPVVLGLRYESGVFIVFDKMRNIEFARSRPLE